MSCLFCKIVNREIPADVLYESESVLAFRDIFPKAPTHVLVIPKVHYPDMTHIPTEDSRIMSDIVEAIQQIVKDLQLQQNGFRVVANTGEHGGQTVFHLHFHLLAGRSFGWPPG